MKGFEDSTQPVFLSLDPVVNTLLGNTTNAPYQIDGAQASTDSFGITVNVSGTRYFVPWGRVYMIRQQQPAPITTVATQVTPTTPTVPKGD